MLRKPFREHHLLTNLAAFEGESLPLDAFLRNYFRKHTAIGSKDRKQICEAVYSIIRWRSLLDHVAKKPVSWESRYQALLHTEMSSLAEEETIPLHVRASFPKAFYELLSHSLGEEKAFAFCRVCNEPAPTTIRVNRLRDNSRGSDGKMEGNSRHFPL